MILDATCGFKSTWFDKENEKTVFLDHRKLQPFVCSDMRNWAVLPTVQAKWQHLPFRDDVFTCVYFDPPHIISKANPKMRMAVKYGTLDPWTWRDTIKKAFKEFMRVLKPTGILVLKWNETSKSLDEFLKCSPLKPLFGTPTKHNSRHQTWFVVFQNNVFNSEKSKLEITLGGKQSQ